MAGCHFHSWDAAGLRGAEALPALWALCCLHRVHQSPSLADPRRQRAVCKMLLLSSSLNSLAWIRSE